MKKTFKNLLRTALTAAAVAVLSVGMAVSVSAADVKLEYIQGTLNTEDRFTGGSDLTSGLVDSNLLKPFDTYNSSISEAGAKKALKFNSGGKLTFTLPAGAENPKLFVVYSMKTTNKNANTLTFGVKVSANGSDIATYDEKAVNVVGYGEKALATGALENNTTYTVARSASVEGGLYYARVTYTMPDGAKTYKLSGTATGLDDGTEITLTKTDNASVSYTATVTGGQWSVETQGVTAPFAAGDTYNVTAPQYNATPSVVTVSGADTTFTVADVAFKLMDLAALAEGNYGADDLFVGLPNFDKSGATAKTSFKFTGDVKFKLDKPQTVTVNVKNGSGSGDYLASFKVVGSGITYLELVDLKAGAKYVKGTTSVAAADETNSSSYATATMSLPAGEYTMTATSDTTTIQFNTKDSFVVAPISQATNDYYITTATDTYVIHAVTEAEMKYAELGIKGADVSTTEVYEAVVINGSTIKASDLGATAIYAIQVTGTNGAIRTADLAWADTAA